ncbi:hypothetical protein EV421DRAFT_1912278 [Armillaria borealis]|uniref:Uncharacterized protein n=1 Tax=Armillaria borealis TaxID=47425 RepID=A0AA39IWI5_9AGAR|nr:hypothetical protein EV421DRAFT_1744432 [Armillaria borealis]KAK0431039.1 hypothetical protein EV421DRAFT_1912278 [Armillaria borealis]
MVTAKKQAGTRKPITPKSVRDKKARLAAERAAREEAIAEQLENAEQRRMERNKELRREADVTAKKLKAARHLIAISTPRDPVPEPKPKRRPSRRNKKKAVAQANAIDDMNLFMFIPKGKNVPGASKEEPGLCARCDKKLIGWPKRKLVVYRQMIPRPFTPAVQFQKMKIMDVDITRTEIRASNNYPDRVNLATTWYHSYCLSEGQLNHIREKGARFGTSIDRELREEILKKCELELEEDNVDVDEEDLPEGSGTIDA